MATVRRPVRARLKVVQNAVLVNGDVIVDAPKTHKRRSVPVPPFVMHSVAEAIRGKQQNELLADAAGRHLPTPTVHEHSRLDRALVTAGLPSMTIHDLRHTAASVAVAAGANVKASRRCSGTRPPR